MNIQIIQAAISSTLSLLNNELESVSYDDLATEYKEVIEQLEAALTELDKR